MKYLDDRITFDFTLTGTLPNAGVYKYELYRFVYPFSQTLVFVGNFYYDGTASVSLDMTDIIRNTKKVLPNLLFTDEEIHLKVDADLINRFKVRIIFGSSNVKDSGWEYVSKTYRIPNYKTYNFSTDFYNDGYNVYWYVYDNDTNQLRTALQGAKVSNGDFVLVPHYPLVETTKYKFSQAFILGSLKSNFTLNCSGGEYSSNTQFQTATKREGTVIMYPIAEYFNFEDDAREWGNNDVVMKDITNDEIIAIFDNCYKRFYLFWQDRLGGYQSQAFNDSINYSESFDTTETQNYQNTRKKSSIQVQQKWKLNSGWINEKLFPIYESIYVSPILLLYDSYSDRIYEVIINSNYIEKTYKSEKKLLNLNLELEASTKQNIIY